jgi:hypothetical protein
MFDIGKVEKTGETVEETFARWDREWKKKHPILDFIDTKILKDKSIADYRGTHALLHPWLIMEYAYRKIKHAWQRVFRGWDDTVIWSIDYYLAEKIPLWIRRLKEDKEGVPNMMFKEGDEIVHEDGRVFPSDKSMERAEKEYDDILDKIAYGFES